jgi:spore germination cell wall hydrolase CwlJ-like protein
MDGTIIEANATAWRDSVNVALFVMTGELKDVTNGADHYYNYNISNPYWVGAMTETAVIGNHRFMKENR